MANTLPTYLSKVKKRAIITTIIIAITKTFLLFISSVYAAFAGHSCN